MSDFSVRLQKIRKEKHISQDELARRSGVSQAAISMIEAEKRAPTLVIMQMLADGLKVPLQDLVGEKEIKKEPAPETRDGLRAEVMELLDDLQEDEVRQAHDYLEWLLSRRGKE